MGILGLKDYARRFLVPYELKSTRLIIVDGNGISINLAKLTKCDDRFGGDYKKLRENMFRFFSKLKDDVTPIVILDGRFKDEKASTMKKRGKGRIDEVKRYNKDYNMGMNYPFYIFKTEILLQVLKNLDIFVCRADFEADEEIIALAGKLNIPVLSIDYDFCICENVTFIPWEDEIFYKGCFKKFDRETFIRVHSVSASVLPLVPVLVNDDYFQMNLLERIQGRKISQDEKCSSALKWLKNKDFYSAKIEIITRLNERSLMDMSVIETKINFVIDNYTNPKVTLDSTFRKNATLKSLLVDIELDWMDVQENVIVKKCGVPEKIVELYREGGLPSLMLDMLTHQEFNARTIAIEDLDEPSTHSASKRLIQGICGLLFKDKDKKLQIKLKIRKDRYIFEDQHSEMLDPLIFSNTIPLQILYEIMEIGEADQNILKFFDGDWLVFILSVIYWKRSCGADATLAHFRSILLTAFYLNLEKDKNKFPDINDDRKISKFFRNLKSGERRKYRNRMKSSQMKNYIIRMKRRRILLTDISHIHMYLIFKNCLFYTIYILTLLGLPCQLKIEEFIDGELYHSFYKGKNKTPESDHFFFGFEHLKNLLFFNHD